jgi:16S rRNA (cytosine967-C5)-methyltransferase
MDLPAELLPALHALTDRLGADSAPALQAAWAAGPAPALRLNPRRGDPAATLVALHTDGIAAEPHPLSPWSCRLDAAGAFRLLGKHPLLTSGAIYLQHLASQLPALLAPDELPGDILDLCAAPGGKTGLLAVRYGPQRIWACERAPIRLEKLRRTLERLDCAAVRVIAGDGRFPPDRLARRRFGLVLVDAPCSGSGVLQLARPGTWRHLAESPGYDAYVALKARQQAQLLRAASQLLAPGGWLIYSTCSADPRENEDIAAGLDAPLSPMDLSAWHGRLDGCGPGLNGEAHCLRIRPGREAAGFFAAAWCHTGASS